MIFAESLNTTNITIGMIGVLLSAVILKLKDLVEILGPVLKSWRKNHKEDEEFIVTELKDRVASLKVECDNLHSSLAYLSHEQLDCRVEEERLWGVIVMLHRVCEIQNSELKELGRDPEPIPPLPERRPRPPHAAAAFLSRTQELNERLMRAAAGPGSGETKQTSSANPADGQPRAGNSP